MVKIWSNLNCLDIQLTYPLQKMTTQEYNVINMIYYNYSI